MKHYINPLSKQVFAYEADGSQDHLIAADLVPITDEALEALRAPDVSEVAALKLSAAKDTVRKFLDTFAQSHDYDSIVSACSYAVSSDPKLKAEGQYCSDARDSTWSVFYTITAAVEAGTRQMPVGLDLIGELPTLAWPTV